MLAENIPLKNFRPNACTGISLNSSHNQITKRYACHVLQGDFRATPFSTVLSAPLPNSPENLLINRIIESNQANNDFLFDDGDDIFNLVILNIFISVSTDQRRAGQMSYTA